MAATSRARNAVATRAAETAPATNGGNGNGKLTIADLINKQRTEIARALPRHMDPDRLARIATTVVKTTPKLLMCSNESLLGALMTSAQTGLEPGPLGHAYFVPRRRSFKDDAGQWQKVWECQWQIGYKGIIELCRRSGNLVSIEARTVHLNDEFVAEFGVNDTLVHKPRWNDRGAPAGLWWMLAKFRDGGHYWLVLDKDEVEARRKRSAAADDGPWITDYDAMAKKTCIRAAQPYLPLSAEIATMIEHDETVHRGIVTSDMVHETPDAIDVPEITAGDEITDAEIVAGAPDDPGRPFTEDEQ